MSAPQHPVTRRVLGIAALMTAVFGRDLLAQTPQQQAAAPDMRPAPPVKAKVRLTVNEQARELELDPRTTLLDALRDHLGLPGTKKGCDHGQCGACTVLVNGVRLNSCLSLAVARDGDRIVTVEGLAQDGKLHPVQQAFVKHDGFQCGFCTPGQICSTVGMLDELRRGLPSSVTADLAAMPEASALEIRERMSGNICRCSAYPNIVAAIMDAHEGSAG
jgi:xanthine dehydrogenase YagT iron-sulfur-binding subunit